MRGVFGLIRMITDQENAFQHAHWNKLIRTKSRSWILLVTCNDILLLVCAYCTMPTLCCVSIVLLTLDLLNFNIVLWYKQDCWGFLLNIGSKHLYFWTSQKERRWFSLFDNYYNNMWFMVKCPMLKFYLQTSNVLDIRFLVVIWYYRGNERKHAWTMCELLQPCFSLQFVIWYKY